MSDSFIQSSLKILSFPEGSSKKKCKSHKGKFTELRKEEENITFLVHAFTSKFLHLKKRRLSLHFDSMVSLIMTKKFYFNGKNLNTILVYYSWDSLVLMWFLGFEN